MSWGALAMIGSVDTWRWLMPALTNLAAPFGDPSDAHPSTSWWVRPVPPA